MTTGINTSLARLLIVDDEQLIRSAMARALQLMGYETAEASTGQEALELLEHHTYDLMLLDLRMPGLSGTEVMKRVNQVSPGLPIIILTGHATLESAITAVKSDEVADYLMKPASVHEVATAIKTALQKRGKPTTQSEPANGRFLYVPPITLDRQRRLVKLDNDPDDPRELTKSEAIVLTCFMEQPGKVFACAELGKAVWGYDVSEDYAQKPIRSIIFRLRGKVEINPQTQGLIRTVRSGGYTFAPHRNDRETT